jgi:hypothetical protein
MRPEDKLEDYDFFRDDSKMNRDSKKLSAWDMFVRRGEPYMKAKLLVRLGNIALCPGVALELVDHFAISSHALADTANILVGGSAASYFIAGLVATGEMVSEHNKHTDPPVDQE